MSTPDPAAGPHLGASLRSVWQWIRDETSTDITSAGFDDLSSAHLQVFRYPGPEGERPSELADRLQMSRQAVNDLVGHLEACGYLTRAPDPADGRARVLRLTDRGRELQSAAVDAAQRAEQRVADAIGRRRLTELTRTLDLITETMIAPD